VSIYKPNKKFIGFKINPRMMVDEQTTNTLLKKFNDPGVINEILENTSFQPLQTLIDIDISELNINDKIKKEEKDEERAVSKRKRDETKEEDILEDEHPKKRKKELNMRQIQNEQKSKHPKSDDSFSYYQEIKVNEYHKNYKDILDHKYTLHENRKYKFGNKLKIVNENRQHLNNKEFIITDTVFNYFESLHIWMDKKLWTNPLIFGYMRGKKVNDNEILYIGTVNGNKCIVEEKNLISL